MLVNGTPSSISIASTIMLMNGTDSTTPYEPSSTSFSPASIPSTEIVSLVKSTSSSSSSWTKDVVSYTTTANGEDETSTTLDILIPSLEYGKKSASSNETSQHYHGLMTNTGVTANNNSRLPLIIIIPFQRMEFLLLLPTPQPQQQQAAVVTTTTII